MRSSAIEIDAIIHMGANSSTTEKDADHLLETIITTPKNLQNIAWKKKYDLFMLLLPQLMEMAH